MKTILPLCLLICLTSGAVTTAQAHGDGASFEETKDGYFIDIGYDPAEPTVGEAIRFDFSVEEVGSTSTTKIHSDVWVRIMHEDRVQFSGGIHRPVFGPTGFAYVPHAPGEYEIFARFQDGSEKIVESSFSLYVTVPEERRSLDVKRHYLGAMVGFLLGLSTCFLFRRFRN